MVLINIETDNGTLTATSEFVEKTYTQHNNCINGGFPGTTPDDVFNGQLGLTFIPFYTIVDSKGTIIYNGSYRDDLFEVAAAIAKRCN